MQPHKVSEEMFSAKNSVSFFLVVLFCAVSFFFPLEDDDDYFI